MEEDEFELRSHVRCAAGMCRPLAMPEVVHDVPSPDEIVLNTSEKVVFIAATRSEIWILPMGNNGNVTKAGWTRLPSQGPDRQSTTRAMPRSPIPGMASFQRFDRRGLRWRA